MHNGFLSRNCLFLMFFSVAALALPACDDSGGSSGADATVGTGGQGGGGQGGGGAGGTGGGAGGGAGGEGGGVPPMSCASTADCPAGAACDPASTSCRPACSADAECGPGARCEAGGFCRSLPSCADGQACPDGQACTCQGVCEPLTKRCQTNLQCETSDFCDACRGMCKPRARPCSRCEDSNGCERRNDVCHPVGREGAMHCLRGCIDQSVCDRLGPGYSCEQINGEGLCVPRSGECASVGDCRVDGDCPDAHFCNEQLVCQADCVDDTACANGTLCQGGRCKPPCAGDGECGPGGVCAEGRCGVPGGCLTSVDCLEPETHCDLPTQLCVPGCERDNDCLDATQECIGTECRARGCGGNYQCAFGEICDLEARACETAMGRHCEPGCDPMDAESCGGEGRQCLSLQDEDENPLGDFCFEPCLEAPNECPQGYQCVDLEDQDGNVTDRLCIRRCDLDPFRGEE